MGREVRSRLTPSEPRTLDAAGAGLWGPRGPPPLPGLQPGLWLPECSLEISHGFSFSEFSGLSALWVSGGLWPRARRRHIRVFRGVVLLSGGDSLPGMCSPALLAWAGGVRRAVEGLSTPAGMPGPHPLPLCHPAASAVSPWEGPGPGVRTEIAGRTPPLSRLVRTGPWRQQGEGAEGNPPP